MNKQEIIEKLHRENSEFAHPRQAISLAELLNIVSSDIYAEGERFMFELLQNADDESHGERKEVHLHLWQNQGGHDYLVVCHYGKPFDERDIEGITSAGQGTKRKDASKTGYKGIGFKSVFGQADWVAIWSNGYFFRFDKSFRHPDFPESVMPWQTIPIWAELDELPEPVQIILRENEYTVATIIRLNDSSKIREYLTTISRDGWVLLFLRTIETIKFFDRGIEEIAIQKSRKNNLVEISNESGLLSQWLVRHFRPIPIPPETKELLKKDRDSPAKLVEADNTEISFAAHISGGEVVRLRNSHIFTYLPTSVRDFNLPFLVNGNFLVTAARTHLHEERIWNKWLIRKTVQMFLEWLTELAQANTPVDIPLRFQLYNLLPRPINNAPNKLVELFYQTLKQQIGKHSFVSCVDGQLRTINSVVLDESGFTHEQILPANAVIHFINDSKQKKFPENAIVHSCSEGTQYLKEYNVHTFGDKDLIAFFQSPLFRKSIDLGNNLKVLKKLRNLHQNQSGLGEWAYIIKNHPFLITDEGELEKIPLVCFPTGTYVTDFGGSVKVIHPELFPHIEADSDLLEWLSEMGVKEPSDLSYLENEIIGRIDDVISEDNFLEITSYVFELFKKGFLTQSHFRALRNLKLDTQQDGFVPAVKCYLPDEYAPTAPVSQFGIPVPLVSEAYLGEGFTKVWRKFFLEIGVSDDIKIINGYKVNLLSEGFPYQYAVEAEQFALEGHTYPHLVNKKYPARIDFITFLNDIQSYEMAKKFWTRFFEKYEITSIVRQTKHMAYGPERQLIHYNSPEGSFESLGYIEWGYYGSWAHIPGYINWCWEHSPCLPVSTGELARATEAFPNSEEFKALAGNYLPILDLDEELSANWCRILNLKTTLELKDILDILDGVAGDLNDQGQIKKFNFKRIGLLYNFLSGGLKKWWDEEKNMLKKWAKNGLLASDSMIPVPPETLFWIKLPGFEKAKDHLQVIFMPSNVEITSEFEQLLGLFQVQIIDRFHVESTFRHPEAETSLFLRVLEILPFLALFLQQKFLVEEAETFLEDSIDLLEAGLLNAYKNIQLNLEIGDQVVPGPNVKAIFHAKQLYYHPEWESPLVRYPLAKELDKMFNSKGHPSEWQTLLEMTPAVAAQWLQDSGIAMEKLNALRNSPAYQKIQEIIERIEAERYLSVPEIPITAGASTSLAAPQDGSHAVLPNVSQIAALPPHILAKQRVVEKCRNMPSDELDFDWLQRTIDWEYEQSKFELSSKTRLVFKYVFIANDRSLHLGELDADELPPLLPYLKESYPQEMLLEIRTPGIPKTILADFEITEATDNGLVLVIDSGHVLHITGATSAHLLLPRDNFILLALQKHWAHALDILKLQGGPPILPWLSAHIPQENLKFIFGPPGTGKTTSLARQLNAQLNGARKIIALAPTNRAADALYFRLLEQQQSAFSQNALIQRFGPGSKLNWSDEAIDWVVVTTVHRFVFDVFSDGLSLTDVQWDTVALDEASMMALPYLFFPFIHWRLHEGPLAVPRFFVAGDPFQLLPVGLTPSLGDLIEFEKESSRFPLKGFSTENIYTLFGIDRFDLDTTPRGPKYEIEPLTHNYRSLPSIVHLFSRFLYLDESGGEILTCAHAADERSCILNGIPQPVISVIDFPAQLEKKDYETIEADHILKYGHGAYHIYSALLASALAKKLLEENPRQSVGLIAPYTTQVRLCEALLKPELKTNSDRLLVSTVHRFQGEETDIMIFLLNPASSEKTQDDKLISGYLAHFNNRNLLNVAISRPKSKLFLLKPEDVFLRSKNSGYVLQDKVLSEETTQDLNFETLHAFDLETVLTGGESLRHHAFIQRVKSFDVFRLSEMEAQAVRWIFLVGPKNLQVILAEELPGG